MHKKTRRTLNYFEHFLLFVSAVSGSASVSTFASLVHLPIEIASSALGLKISAITSGAKKCKSIIKQRRSMIKECC